MDNKNLDFIIELYNFHKTVNKMLASLSPDEIKKFSSQVSWFMKKANKFIEDNGVSFVSQNPGDPYDVGLPVTPVNIADFDKETELVIDQVMEPTVMHNGKVVQMGTVLLKKAEKND